jgi:hypothetical protein
VGAVDAAGRVLALSEVPFVAPSLPGRAGLLQQQRKKVIEGRAKPPRCKAFPPYLQVQAE